VVPRIALAVGDVDEQHVFAFGGLKLLRLDDA
jgi:hypothetical protein